MIVTHSLRVTPVVDYILHSNIFIHLYNVTRTLFTESQLTDVVSRSVNKI